MAENIINPADKNLELEKESIVEQKTPEVTNELADDGKPKKRLYKLLRDTKDEDGISYYTKDYKSFDEKYSAPENIDNLYTILSEDKKYTKSKDDFYKEYFPELKKKEKPLESGTATTSLSESQSQLPVAEEKPKEKRPFIMQDGKPVYDFTYKEEEVSEDPISILNQKKKADLDFMSQSWNQQSNDNYRNKVSSLNDKLKSLGVEPGSADEKALIKEVSDIQEWFPDNAFRKQIFEVRAEDPANYYNYINQIKARKSLISGGFPSTQDRDKVLNDLNSVFLNTGMNKKLDATSALEPGLNVPDTKEKLDKSIESINQYVSGSINALQGVPNVNANDAIQKIKDGASHYIYYNFTPDKAKQYLTEKIVDGKLSGDLKLKEGTEVPNPAADPDIEQKSFGQIKYDPLAPKTVKVDKGNFSDNPDLSNYSLLDIKSKLDPNNFADNLIFDIYSSQQSLSDALNKAKTSIATSDEKITNAAIDFYRNIDPQIQKQYEELDGDLPENLKASLLSNFLADRNAENMATQNGLGYDFFDAKKKFNVNHTDYASRTLGIKIGQYMEDIGENDDWWKSIVNLPTADQLDGIVSKMKEDGLIDDVDIDLYKSKIRGDVDFLSYAGRFLSTPFGGGAWDQALVPTSDLVGGVRSGIGGAITGIGATAFYALRDLTPLGAISKETGIGENILSDKHRLASIINEGVIAKFKPNEVHAIMNSMGSFTGLAMVMAASGGAFSALGLGTKAAHTVNAAVNFYGHNYDKALEMYPGNTTKDLMLRYTSTGANTLVDTYVSKFLPIDKLTKGAVAAFKNEQKVILEKFYNGAISSAEATKTLGNKFYNTVLSTGKHALTTGTVLTGLEAYHNLIDKMLGGNQMDLSDIGKQAIESFLPNIASSAMVSVFAAMGERKNPNDNITYNHLYEIAQNPDLYYMTLDNMLKADPSKANIEKIDNIRNNIKTLVEANNTVSDPTFKNLNEDQRKKYIALSVLEKSYLDKSTGTTDATASKAFADKANEIRLQKANILNGVDNASDIKLPENPGQELESERIASGDPTVKPAEKQPIYKLDGQEVTKERLVEYLKNKEYEDNPLPAEATYDEEVQQLIRDAEYGTTEEIDEETQQKAIEDDKKNTTRILSPIGEGEAVKPTELKQEPGTEEAGTGGVLQAQGVEGAVEKPEVKIDNPETTLESLSSLPEEQKKETIVTIDGKEMPIQGNEQVVTTEYHKGTNPELITKVNEVLGFTEPAKEAVPGAEAEAEGQKLKEAVPAGVVGAGQVGAGAPTPVLEKPKTATVPFEITTYVEGEHKKEYEEAVGRMISEGVPEAQAHQDVIKIVAEGLKAELPNILKSEGVEAEIVSISDDYGGYTNTETNKYDQSPNIIVELSEKTKPEDVQSVMNGLNIGATQQSANAFMEATPEEIANNNPDVHGVFFFRKPEGMSNESFGDMMVELNNIKDGEGNSVLTGHTPFGNNIIGIGGHFYGKKFVESVEDNIDKINDVLTKYGVDLSSSSTQQKKILTYDRSRQNQTAEPGQKPSISERDRRIVQKTRDFYSNTLSGIAKGEKRIEVKPEGKQGEVKFSKEKEGVKKEFVPDVTESIVDEMNTMGGFNIDVNTSEVLSNKGSVDIKSFENREGIVEKPNVVLIKDFAGKPMLVTISDELTTGDVTNPITGNKIENLKGGIGFNYSEGNTDFAWAYTNEKAASDVLAAAKKIYESNPDLYPDGIVPVAVVKMGKTAMVSNEALIRQVVDNLTDSKIPDRNKRNAFKVIKQDIKNQLSVVQERIDKSKGNPTASDKAKLKGYRDILTLIDNVKSFDELLNNVKNLNIGVRPLLIERFTSGNPDLIPSENRMSVDKPASKELMKGLPKSEYKRINLGYLISNLTDPSLKNVPDKHIISFVGIDAKAEAPIKNETHPNYPYALKGKGLGIVEETAHIGSVMPSAYGNILSKLIGSEEAGKVVTNDQIISAGLPAALNNKVFKNKPLSERALDYNKLLGYLQLAFPNTQFFTDPKTWGDIMDSKDVKKYLKDGEVVYGITKDGHIYLNPNYESLNTPIHEAGHIHLDLLEQTNPELLNKGLSLVENTPEFEKSKNELGDNINARKEALAILIGNKGETITDAAMKSKFKEWLLAVYKYIQTKFPSLKNLTPEQIADLTLEQFVNGSLRDILGGKEVSDKKIGAEEPKFSKEAPKEEKETEGQKPTGISKAQLKEHYGFVKDFESTPDKVTADRAMTSIETAAQDNNISVGQQAENMVATMLADTKNRSVSDQDILTAAYHLKDLDQQIEKANDNKQDASLLIDKRNRVLEVLRELGRRSGANLRLIGMAYSKSEDNRIEITRAQLKRDLGVPDVPKTKAELDALLKSKGITKEDYDKVLPYVQEIEKVTASIKEIEKNANAEIESVNKEALKEYIDKEIKRRIESGEIKITVTKREKTLSEKGKDMADKIRKLKIQKGDLPSDITFGLRDLAVEAVAQIVEKGATVAEAIAEVVKDVRFAGKLSAKQLEDHILKGIDISDKKDEAITKITEMSDNSGAKNITTEMVEGNLINNIVDSYIHSQTAYEDVVPNATKELKKILPDVTEKDVEQALLRTGKFKSKTKQELSKDFKDKKNDVKRLIRAKNRLDALESADDANREVEGEEDKQKKKDILSKRKSEYEKKIDEQVNDLKKQKQELEKQKKEGKKLASIQEEIDFVNANKSVFNKALNNPKEANQELVALKLDLKDAYNKAGIRIESGNKNEIRIAQEAEKEIKAIEDGDLPDDIKKQNIEDVKKRRDEDIKNTKQSVLVSLKDNIDSKLSELTSAIDGLIVSSELSKEDLADIQMIKDAKKDLSALSEKLSPNRENLKDQIDKADQKLSELAEKYEGTEIGKSILGIQDAFRKKWQMTSEEIQRQTLLDQADRELAEIERKINAGQYTSIPTTKLEAKEDNIVTRKQAQVNKAMGKLNSLAAKAREKQETKGIVDKWLKIRRDLMVMSFGAIEKVAGSAITKPIIDPLIKQTFGRLSGVVTGISPTKFKDIKKTYGQIKNTEKANQFITDTYDNYTKAIEEYDDIVNKYGEDSKEAEDARQKLDDAEIQKEFAIAYLFVNANSAIDIAQVLVKGATDFDSQMGKYAQSERSERGKLENVWYWIESINRTHGAMKSISNRQAVLDYYFENLQYIQQRDGKITLEGRQEAWDVAVLLGESGRFGEETALSRKISEFKGASVGARRVGNWLLPVAKIGINITKQGIDMAFPFLEAGSKAIKAGKKGMGINEQQGNEYNGFVSKFYDGVKTGFDKLPLEQKQYINTLISRGLFGLAQYALVGYLLSSGGMKYGGVYNPYDKEKVIGSDGKPLKHGQWEIGGVRMPELFNIVFDHSPYCLPASIATSGLQNYKKGDGYKIISGTVNEVYARLPFQTTMNIVQAATGDKFKAELALAAEVPSFKTPAQWLDGRTNEEIKVYTDDFTETVGNIIKSRLPFLRSTLESKPILFTEKDVESNATLKRVQAAGVSFPEIGTKKFEVSTDKEHPEGQMSPAEKEKFLQRLRVNYTKEISSIMNSKWQGTDQKTGQVVMALGGEGLAKYKGDKKRATTALQEIVNQALNTAITNSYRDLELQKAPTQEYEWEKVGNQMYSDKDIEDNSKFKTLRDEGFIFPGVSTKEDLSTKYDLIKDLDNDEYKKFLETLQLIVKDKIEDALDADYTQIDQDNYGEELEERGSAVGAQALKIKLVKPSGKRSNLFQEKFNEDISGLEKDVLKEMGLLKPKKVWQKY